MIKLPSFCSSALLLSGLLLMSCSETSRQDLAAATALVRAGNYAEAEVLLRNLSARDTPSDEVRFALARVFYLRGRFDDAARTLSLIGGTYEPALVDALRIDLALKTRKPEEVLQSLNAGRYRLDAAALSIKRAEALIAWGRVPDALDLLETIQSTSDTEVPLRTAMAKAHARHLRWSRAMEQLDLVTKNHASAAEAWMVKAALHEALGRNDEARRAARKAIEYSPGRLTDSERSALLLAEFGAAAAAGDLARARLLSGQLTGVLSSSPILSLVSAEMSALEGRYDDAVAELQGLIQRQAGFLPARVSLLAILVEADRLELALRESGLLAASSPSASRLVEVRSLLTLATKAAPGSEARAMHSASALSALGERRAAQRLLSDAVRRHPTSATLMARLASIQLALGLLTEAKRSIDEALARDGSDPSALMIAADIATQRGELTAALAICERLFASSPSGASAVALSRIRAKIGREDDEKPIRDWLARKPEDTAVRLILAEKLMATGNARSAASEYETVLATSPSDPVALNNLALLYDAAGDGRALDVARRAFEAAAVPEIADTFGWLLIKSGDSKRGLDLLERAVVGSPKAAIRAHLALALKRAGQVDRATAIARDLEREKVPFDGQDQIRGEFST